VVRFTMGFEESVQVPAEFYESGQLLPIALALGPAFARDIGQALIDHADAAEMKECGAQLRDKARDKRCPAGVPRDIEVTAKLVRDDLTVLVTYRIGDADAVCRPTVLSLTADVSDDFSGGDGLDYRIEDEGGQVELPLQGHVANADVLLANTWTPANGGLSSDNTTIRIRGALAPEPTITVPAPPIPDPGRLPGAPPLER